MVCWNDSITRSVELTGFDGVFMEVFESKMPFRSETEHGIGAPDLTALSRCTRTGCVASGVVFDGEPLVTCLIACDPLGEMGLSESGASRAAASAWPSRAGSGSLDGRARLPLTSQVEGDVGSVSSFAGRRSRS